MSDHSVLQAKILKAHALNPHLKGLQKMFKPNSHTFLEKVIFPTKLESQSQREYIKIT